MSKQNEVTGNQQKRNHAPKKTSSVAEEGAKQDSLPGLPENPVFAAGDPSNQSGADLISDSRFLTVQRRDITSQIGKVGGNQYLQRVLGQMREKGPRESSTPLHMHPVDRFVNTQAIVQRDGEGNSDDTEWAKTTRTPVEAVQKAAIAAQKRLNKDAGKAIEHHKLILAAYKTFQKNYDEAVADVVAGVKESIEKAEEFRKNIAFVATSLLAAYAPMVSTMYGAVDGVLGKVERIASMVDAVSTPKKPSDKKGDDSPGARRENRVDWVAFAEEMISTQEKTLSKNVTLTDINEKCASILSFLSDVQDGEYGGNSPRTSSLGLKATEMVGKKESVVTGLKEIDEGTVSGAAGEMAGQVAERLEGVTVLKLKQDIAIRWIAGLGEKKLDDIDKAEDYLRSIGVIDAEGNRLDYDTGDWTSDIDEKIIHWRAQWENIAMEMVGSTATWLGSTFSTGRGDDAKVYGGRVRDNRNIEWDVSIAGGAPASAAEGGGQVLLTSYRIDHRDSSDWEWSHPYYLRELLKNEVIFTATPLGTLGGGAPPPSPVINPAD